MGEHTKLEALDMSIDPRECVLYYFRDAYTRSPRMCIYSGDGAWVPACLCQMAWAWQGNVDTHVHAGWQIQRTAQLDHPRDARCLCSAKKDVSSSADKVLLAMHLHMTLLLAASDCLGVVEIRFQFLESRN
jgi:hypothetical protein